MGAKVLASSVGVLDEADRTQRIIDWMLFTQEQDYRLNYSEHLVVTWRPGDPLHPRPQRSLLFGGYAGGNYIRQMIEEIDDEAFNTPEVPTYHLLECYDCEVWWDDLTDGVNCWVCGVKSKDANNRRAYTSYSSDRRGSSTFDDYSTQMVAYSAADGEVTRLDFRRLNEGARRAGEAMSSTMADAMHRVQQQVGEMMETIWRRHYEEMDRQTMFGGDRNAEPTGISIGPFSWDSYISEWTRPNQAAFIHGRRQGSSAMQRMIIDEWVSERPEEEPETVVINGISMPRDIPTTPEIPLPDMERVSIWVTEEPRYVNSEPVWSRRRR